MRRALILGMVIAATSGGVAQAATVSPPVSQRDSASTRAFIRAEELLDTTIVRDAPQLNASATAEVAQVSAACPDVLAAAPAKGTKAQQNAQSAFLGELDLAVLSSATVPLHPAAQQFGSELGQLRFSSSLLQWEVRVSAASDTFLYTLPVPDVCADARFYAASHFDKVSKATQSALGELLVVGLGAGAGPNQLLTQMRPYAPAAVAAAKSRLNVLNRRADELLSLDPQIKQLYEALYNAAPPTGLTTSAVHL